MGKSTTSNSKKKGSTASAATTASPVCKCDDPYKCTCGNRPPRPSKGHKWDTETQAWTGKGHKQKGGSGQIASLGTVASVTKVGKTTVAQWQRLPSQLLLEYCTRQNRPPFKSTSLSVDTPPQHYKYRVVVKDPKNSDNDLFFVPSTPVANEEQAKEEACLLALLELTPELPHERKLPEPYKTTWLHSINARKTQTSNNDTKKKTSNTKKSVDPTTNTLDVNRKDVNMYGDGNNNTNDDSTKDSSVDSRKATASTSLTLDAQHRHTSKAAKQQAALQKRQLQNARIRKHENIRLANQPHAVHLCAQLRKQIQDILRGDSTIIDDNSDDGGYDYDTSQDIEILDPENDAQAYIEERLCSEGFTRKQARKAYQHQQVQDSAFNADESSWESLYESSLQWLLVHLDEDKLPEGFDPRGGTLEIIPATSYKNTSKPNQLRVDSSNDAEAQMLANHFSLTFSDATLVLNESKQNQKTPEITFFEMIQHKCKLNLQKSDNQELQSTPDENNTLLEEELEAISAIFGDECNVSQCNDNLVLIKFRLEGSELVLSILVEKRKYPAQPPVYALVSGQWPANNVGVAFHIKFINYLKELPVGEPMLFALHGQALTILYEINSLENMDLANKELIQSSNFADTNNSTNVKLLRSVIQHVKRPRERAAFWTVMPSDVPTATAFPNVSKSLQAARQSLPAYRTREKFLSLVQDADKADRVILITGETGCGKTTQIPQFLLEEYPKQAKIVVCQPRRLAATSVARRVAEEREEGNEFKFSVGYSVRGDTKTSANTRLLFCTTGVLLRQLQCEDALKAINTIIIDEVHERSLDTDILMGILKKLLPSLPHLRLVLMSATLNANQFAAYWGQSTPQMDIPGRSFPVTDFMLEDVLSITGYIPKKRKNGLSSQDERYTSKGDGANGDEEAGEEGTISDQGLSINKLMHRIDQNDIDYELVASLVVHIVNLKTECDDGSILIFLPGALEISKAIDAIRRRTTNMFVQLLPLHGGLQPAEQSVVFRKPQPGFTKIVVSTNVAETSITIPDCTVVIDSAREKQASYDPSNRMPILTEQFCSKASLKQRRGRAGRVREGTCYKLISARLYAGLNEYTEPEIKKCALDQTLLSLLFLKLESNTTGKFLRTLLDPPTQQSINSATYSLEKIGAVEVDYQTGDICLTPLGLHLAGIPASPIIGKSSILGCRSSALAMAAGMSLTRSPWLRVEQPRKDSNSRSFNIDTESSEIEQMKVETVLKARSELYEKVGKSDHAQLAAVYMEWQSCSAKGGERVRFCNKFGLHVNAMREMNQLREQLESSLVVLGFTACDSSERNSSSWRILQACAVASMSPSQLVKVVRPATRYEPTAEGSKERQGQAKELQFYIRLPNMSAHEDCSLSVPIKFKEERVFIHPLSTNFSSGSYSCPWLVYHTLVRTNKPFLRDITECKSYPLLLFGGDLQIQAANNTVVVDQWCTLSANARIGSLIGALRQKVDELLREKVADPRLDIAASSVMKMIVRLIISDGLPTTAGL